jgi:hypothetical protein
LADVYAAIAFYLNHQQEVETYLQLRQQQAQEIRKMNEARAAGDITAPGGLFFPTRHEIKCYDRNSDRYSRF